MRDEEVFVVFTMLVLFGVIVWLALRHNLRREKLKTIQRAIESNALDAATRDRLIDALAEDARRTNQVLEYLRVNGIRLVRALLVIVGWFTFVISSVMVVAMTMAGTASRYDIIGGTVAIGIGFACLTLPMALREVHSRSV